MDETKVTFNQTTMSLRKNLTFNSVNNSMDTSVETNYSSNIVLCVVMFLGAISNGVLICYVLRRKQLRTSPTYIILVSLALADLCFLLFTIAVLLLPLWQHFLPFDLRIACVFTVYGSAVFGITSRAHLVIFSLFRYLILTQPFWSRVHLNGRKTTFLCIGTWIGNLLSSSPLLFYTSPTVNVNGQEDQTNCTLQGSNVGFGVYIAVINLILLLLILIFHVVKVVHLKKLNLAIQRNKNSQSHAHRVSNRAVIGIISMYATTTTPLLIVSFMVFYLDDHLTLPSYVETVVLPVVSVIMFLNSVANPFLYFFLSRTNNCCLTKMNTK